MPTYRVISEIDPAAEHRASRGQHKATQTGESLDRRITVVQAADLAEAAIGPAAAGYQGHTRRRIVSIEEIHPGFTFTDEQITTALSGTDQYGNEMAIDPDEYEDDEKIYEGGDFIFTVRIVADALRESGLVPELDISLLSDVDFNIDYAMVKIYDRARFIHLSHGSELKNLTDDRDATGWDGILAIARQLISISNDLH